MWTILLALQNNVASGADLGSLAGYRIKKADVVITEDEIDAGSSATYVIVAIDQDGNEAELTAEFEVSATEAPANDSEGTAQIIFDASNFIDPQSVTGIRVYVRLESSDAVPDEVLSCPIKIEDEFLPLDYVVEETDVNGRAYFFLKPNTDMVCLRSGTTARYRMQVPALGIDSTFVVADTTTRFVADLL